MRERMLFRWVQKNGARSRDTLLRASMPRKILATLDVSLMTVLAGLSGYPFMKSPLTLKAGRDRQASN